MNHFNQAEHKIVMGLGNPGKEYENTRHNVGFAVVDALASKYKIELSDDKKLSSLVGKGSIEVNGQEKSIILSKPTTYMNNSGFAASKILNWFKLTPISLLVIHDEVAIDLGKIRVSKDRGAGGHHGIESTINNVGANFTRIRLGVGPDPGGDIRADYVLGKFNNKDHKIFTKVIDATVEAIEMLFEFSTEDVMNKFNGLEIVK